MRGIRTAAMSGPARWQRPAAAHLPARQQAPSSPHAPLPSSQLRYVLIPGMTDEQSDIEHLVRLCKGRKHLQVRTGSSIFGELCKH